MSFDFNRNGETVMVVSPHVDDEVLGCAGVLDANCHVHFCGIDESAVAPDAAHRIPLAAREAELADVAAFFGYRHHVDRSSLVNRYNMSDQIPALEAAINQVRPCAVFIPFPDGYNQDHRTIYDACRVALRPHDRNHFVKRVFVYEAVHDLLWSRSPFEPAYFLPIDIERKVDGYRRHASQVRGMRSPDMIRTHARMRGMMANCEYAEAFEVQRWVA